MNHCLLFLLSIVLVMVTSGFAQKNEAQTFTAGGRTHYCIWHVPKDCNKPPVVFFVHGANGSGKNFQNETRGDTVADREKFIAVYPSASANGGTGAWADMYGTSDYPFYLAVIDTLKKRYSIDTTRIYMTGFSQGGMISYVAACSYSKVFAAVAPVSGHTNSDCKLSRPVSVFMTFGTKDIGTPSTFIADLNTWLKLDSCPSAPKITKFYPTGSSNSKVTRITYGPCAQGTYIIADSIQGGQHEWPNANRGGPTKQAEEVWAFFKQFTLNGPTTNISFNKGISYGKPVVISYSSGIIHLQGVEKNCNVKVTNTKGQVVLNKMNSGSQLSFANKPSGVYLVVAGEKKNIAMSKIVVP